MVGINEFPLLNVTELISLFINPLLNQRIFIRLGPPLPMKNRMIAGEASML